MKKHARCVGFVASVILIWFIYSHLDPCRGRRITSNLVSEFFVPAVAAVVVAAASAAVLTNTCTQTEDSRQSFYCGLPQSAFKVNFSLIFRSYPRSQIRALKHKVTLEIQALHCFTTALYYLPPPFSPPSSSHIYQYMFHSFCLQCNDYFHGEISGQLCPRLCREESISLSVCVENEDRKVSNHFLVWEWLLSVLLPLML